MIAGEQILVVEDEIIAGMGLENEELIRASR